MLQRSRLRLAFAALGLLGLTALLAGPASGILPEAEAAAWRDFTGRMAPDMTFTETAQGIKPGTRLSSFRGKKVVVLAFWLRDCRHCKRELPRVQAMHEASHRSGLQVISIVHDRYTLPQILPVMTKRGWTFPVVRDLKGSMAAKFGGGRRPGFYVIGIDGRVKSSNSLSARIVKAELGRWRLHELEAEGAMPEALKKARGAVSQGNYGAALRAAEAEGSKAGASGEVRAAVVRLKRIAATKLQNRVDKAQGWYAAGDVKRAQGEYDAILRTFKGTSLESKAKTLRDQFAAKTAGG